MSYQSFYLCHYGKPGMKWGYNDGKRNGKDVAADPRERYRLAAQNRRNARRASNVNRSTQQTTARRQLSTGLYQLKSGVKRYAGAELGRYQDAAKAAKKKISNYAKSAAERSKANDKKTFSELNARKRYARESERKGAKQINNAVNTADKKYKNFQTNMNRKLEDTDRKIVNRVDRAKKSASNSVNNGIKKSNQYYDRKEKKVRDNVQTMKKRTDEAGRQVRNSVKSVAERSKSYDTRSMSEFNKRKKIAQESRRRESEEILGAAKTAKKEAKRIPKRVSKAKKRAVKKGKRSLSKALRKWADDLD